MAKIVKVRTGDYSGVKTAYAGSHSPRPREKWIISIEKNLDWAEVLSEPEEVMLPPLGAPSLVRRMTAEDFKKLNQRKKEEAEIESFIKDYIEQNHMNMKLIKAHFYIDRSKLIVYFSSETRVDFRALVKTLAKKFHTRIEMKQIGPREAAFIYGGIGVCGRPVCCHTLGYRTRSVPLASAREQFLQPNPSKISGICGYLMCCLMHEVETYKEEFKNYPRLGSVVEFEKEGEKKIGVLRSLNVFTKIATVDVEGEGMTTINLEETTLKKKLLPGKTRGES